jgi:uncharacterized protein YbjT (DUF2867 family)
VRNLHTLQIPDIQLAENFRGQLMNTQFQNSTVVIAGARGFVGQALVERLRGHAKIVGLSRRASHEEGVEWRECDLFSRADTIAALKGADFAVYLVHSMLPSARLTQGDFEDFDLICADNFARAAKENSVKHIVYLGGILPEGEGVSRHLGSRHEVEHALGAYGTPVTSLRAGLIVGPNGSSTAIVVRLVQKLPVMLCPSWTRERTQPIALKDILGLIEFSLGNEDVYDQIFDVGGPDIMTYKMMMERTAELLNLKRVFFDFPAVAPAISSGWVSAFTHAPMELVRPLIESLEHSMVARENTLLEKSRIAVTPFSESMKESIEFELSRSEEPVAFDKRGSSRPAERVVRSVQRLPLPKGKDAAWVAEEYARWLPDFLAPILRVEVTQEFTRFFIKGITSPLLELKLAEVSATDRQLFWIVGGLLARPNRKGRLEFREVLGGQAVMAAIHDFEPRLPWYIYRYTQALVHLFVMHGFGEHLRKISTN